MLAYLKDYDRELLRIFGTLNPVHFQAPCFGSPIDWHAVSSSHGRRETIKKLLCIIGDLHPNLEYAPIIPAITTILAKKLEPGDVLACVTAMIEGHSIPAYKRQDWAYFPLFRRDYLVFKRVFEDLLGNFAPKVSRLIAKFELLEPEFVPPWDKLLSTFFIEILPREMVLRIFDSYVVEGYKIILRFAMAHIMIRQDRILQKTKCSRDLTDILLAPEEHSPDQLKTYFKTAFQIKFDRAIIQRFRNRRRKHSIGDYDAEDKRLMFQRPLPQLQRPSRFVRDEEWASIWSWIPPRYRLLNLDLAFTTAEHGLMLSTLVTRCDGHEPLLLLIETMSGKVLGAYLSKALDFRHGPSFYGTGETFLFTLKPEMKKYPWDLSSGNHSFVCVTDAFLACGTGADFGLWIDRFLNRLTSGPSATFANAPMVDAAHPDDLQIYCLEAFRFV